MSRKLRSSSGSTFPSFKLKTLSAAFISALVLTSAHAAGLGKLTVLSSLGQPLRAEIELTSVASDEAGSLVPRLASAAAFRQIAYVDFETAALVRLICEPAPVGGYRSAVLVGARCDER